MTTATMRTPVGYEEYLAEIRSQVCSNCVERPPGGPPCAAVGKICGVEQHLPELIEAIHDIRSSSIGPYWQSKQHQVCDSCAFRHSSICPCPLDYLLVLIVEAVETVDARHERHDMGRLRSPDRGESAATDIRQIKQIYADAAHSWTGCDWPTKFGKLNLDLNGCTAAQARRKAAVSIGEEADEWRNAEDWLARLEQYAKQAQEHAAEAVRAAAAGDWPEALEQARQAWDSEFATGRVVWRGFPMTWHRLLLAMEDADASYPNAAEMKQIVLVK